MTKIVLVLCFDFALSLIAKKEITDIFRIVIYHFGYNEYLLQVCMYMHKSTEATSSCFSSSKLIEKFRNAITTYADPWLSLSLICSQKLLH